MKMGWIWALSMKDLISLKAMTMFVYKYCGMWCVVGEVIHRNESLGEERVNLFTVNIIIAT